MRRTAAVLVAVLLVALALAAGGPRLAAAAPGPGASPSITGNITGPTVLGYNTHHQYEINATGGPAFAANGTQVGNVTYYASITGSNTTGVSVTPSESGIVDKTAQETLLTVGNVTEVLTIVVEITSTYKHLNESYNMTYLVNVVQPFTLSMTLLSTTSSTILGFSLTIFLDGTPVGSIQVPSLTGRESYVATFSYATLGLGPGYHTFTASLASEHGLVTFAGGATSYSTTFYIPGPPPDNTVWYVAGIVAFLGAVFIFVTRVAARRRAPAKK